MYASLANVLSNPSTYLKYGQLGVGLAMVTLGYYLHLRALRGGRGIRERRLVAKQFMFVAVFFFSISVAVEVIKLFMTPEIGVRIAAPPLQEINPYGNINIRVSHLDGDTETLQFKPALTASTLFKARQGTDFTIDVSPMVKYYQDIHQSYRRAFAKGEPDLAPPTKLE